MNTISTSDKRMPGSNSSPLLQRSSIVNDENDADDFDQAQLEKLSEKETDDESTTTTTARASDDIIPNAIVIKNIPFAIKKEQLLDIIDEMGLPLPYAFNYHFDNGIFRGLAFANFTTAEETMDVITHLNGKEINGRKLKVEYKKMLPQAERERIEREKREKRGQLEEQHRNSSNMSLQSLGKMSKTLNLSQNGNSGAATANNNAAMSAQIFSSLMGGGAKPSNNTGGSNVMAQQNTANSYYSQQSQSQPHPQFHSQTPVQQQTLPPQTMHQQQMGAFGYVNNNNGSVSGAPGSAVGERFYAPLPSSSTVPIPPQHLDFNDPDTLEIYSQLLLFRDREKQYTELAYPIGLSGNHKRVINVLCSYLNLVEVYDPRFVIIKRKYLDQASLQSHLQQQGQMPTMHPLQPNSTGGSLNRSHSYTSLLQAHASAAAAANATSNTNDNNSVLSQNSAQMNASGAASLLAQTAAQQNSLGRAFQNQNQGIASPTPLYSSAFYNNEQAQGSNPSLHSPLLSNGPSQIAQSPQTSQQQQQSQQQQGFLRQPNPLTPSARIPSGYSSNTQSLSSSNPLLRNSSMNASSPSMQSSTTQRILSSLHNNLNSPSQLHDQVASNANDHALLQQNTSGSVHSNFSTQSYHDENTNMSMNNGNASSIDAIYGGMSSSGLDSGLEHHLSRSLSGLDVSGTQGDNGTPVKKSVW
ncbi:Pin4 protein [Maudiozyma humilis]|uniref:Pin4 protein n=1 Tax=Maudiozyma humilis TaxID=51915 RepID=A0AAV5RZQ8_MAUHU|nr:Pin4 protein [Kazachstania humilis]